MKTRDFVLFSTDNVQVHYMSNFVKTGSPAQANGGFS